MRKNLILSMIICVVFSLLFASNAMAKDWKDVDLGYYNQEEFEELTETEITSFNESPILKEQFESGELPPVEERLPDNPLVQTPWMEIGEYGGTLRWTDVNQGGDLYLRHMNSANLVLRPPSSKYHLFSGLDGPSQPGVFESWNMSDDGKVFTATIRKGLKWSDGVSVTTEDIAYYINDVLKNEEVNPTLPKWLRWGGSETKLKVVDDYTFRFIFTSPYGSFLENELREWPGTWAQIMRPKHYVKKFHKDYTDMEQILPIMEDLEFEKEEWGSFYQEVDPQGLSEASFIGLPYPPEYPTLDPYMVVEELDEGNWLLARNPYFFMIDPEGNQLPYIDYYRREYVSNIEMTNMAIISGQTDIQGQMIQIQDYPLFAENQEEGNYNLMPLRAWQEHVLIYLFNMSHADPKIRNITSDKKFRQAMSLALDREHIKESLFLGFGKAAQVAPRPSSQFYEEGMEESYVEHDPERAGELLDEIGLVDKDGDGWRETPDGETFIVPFDYYIVTPVAAEGAELAKRYWEEIGVKVNITQRDGGYFWQIMNANEIVVTDWWLAASGASLLQNWWFGFRLTAPEWQSWYLNDGEMGIEPPDWAKEMLEAHEKLVSEPKQEKVVEYGKKIWKLQAENLVVIGTVFDPVTPFVISQDIGNVEIAKEKDYVNVTVMENAIQWYFKNPERLK